MPRNHPSMSVVRAVPLIIPIATGILCSAVGDARAAHDRQEEGGALPVELARDLG